jgi:hypothetical protein
MVEIYVAGRSLDLYPGTSIKYSFQNSDFFDVANVKATHTNSYDIPKTPKNTQILEGLGLVGDTSTVPYTQTPVNVKYFGFDITPKGWLDVKETAENYKINIIDGMIDFFKDVEKKKIGVDLNLSALDHSKNVQTVVDSFTNPNYRYIIGDYAGKVYTTGSVINSDYLIPSVRVPYLFNTIFNTFGYTYSGNIFNDPDFKDLWLTYTKDIPNADSEALTPFAEATYNAFTDTRGFTPIGTLFFRDPFSWSTSSALQGSFLGSRYVVPEAGNYKIDLTLRGKGLGLIRRESTPGGLATSGPSSIPYNDYYRVKVYRNSVEVGEALSDLDTARVSSIYVAAQPGDVIDFKFCLVTTRAYSLLQFINRESSIDISKTTLGAVDFEEALKDLTVKDFFKEICIRYALIPAYHSRTKNIEFYTFKDIINRANAVDWSNRYVSRKKEAYSFSSFAQVNKFRQKYNEDNLSFNDGELYTGNANLEEEKTTYTSKFYSADREPVDLLGRATYRLPCFKTEVKEEAGEAVVEYSALSGRFYALRDQTINESITLESEIFSESITSASFPFVLLQDNYFIQLISKYYGEHSRILKDLRVHEIELALGIADILTLDLKKLYYFEQEKQYYILNKLTWEPGKTSVGEFIRVKI